MAGNAHTMIRFEKLSIYGIFLETFWQNIIWHIS